MSSKTVGVVRLNLAVKAELACVDGALPDWFGCVPLGSSRYFVEVFINGGFPPNHEVVNRGINFRS